MLTDDDVDRIAQRVAEVLEERKEGRRVELAKEREPAKDERPCPTCRRDHLSNHARWCMEGRK
jgi:hypothetical protein